jgi:hypothetical protein
MFTVATSKDESKRTKLNALRMSLCLLFRFMLMLLPRIGFFASYIHITEPETVSSRKRASHMLLDGEQVSQDVSDWMTPSGCPMTSEKSPKPESPNDRRRSASPRGRANA